MPKQVLELDPTSGQYVNPVAPTGQNNTPGDDAQKGKYRPSAYILGKIQAIPDHVKKEVLDVYGVNIDDLTQKEQRFGTLEGIATGNFTLYPMQLVIDETARIRHEVTNRFKREGKAMPEELAKSMTLLPNLGKEKTLATFRLWYVASNDSWGMEIHRVKCGLALDQNGEPMKNDDGSEKKTIDRQPLDENSVIDFYGKSFTKDEMDHLRLTGTLGKIFLTGEKNDKQVNVFVDNWNNHETITMNNAYVKAQYESRMNGKDEFQMEVPDENGNLTWKKFRLGEDAKKSAPTGAYVWAENVDDPSEKVNVWFDPRFRRFVPTIASNPHIGFEEARRIEVKAKVSKQQKAASQETTKSQGKKRG